MSNEREPEMFGKPEIVGLFLALFLLFAPLVIISLFLIPMRLLSIVCGKRKDN